MEKHRYYFRLKKSIGELCRETDKDLPSEKALGKIARLRGFAFNEKSVQPALYENAPFADGLLHALSVWLGARENDIAEFTLDCPQHREARMGDFFLQGMRPLVERLTGSHRLKEEAFFKSEKDIDRANEINLCEVGTVYVDSSTREPTKEDLMRTALNHANLTGVGDLHAIGDSTRTRSFTLSPLQRIRLEYPACYLSEKKYTMRCERGNGPSSTSQHAICRTEVIIN